MDRTIDVLTQHARRGRPASDLALILFAHRLPVPGELVRSALSAELASARSFVTELTRDALDRFPAPLESGLELSPAYERAEALAKRVTSTPAASVRTLRRNLRSAGRPAGRADVLQTLTHLFHTLQGVVSDDDESELSADVMRAFVMHDLLESAAPNVPPLLGDGPVEFMRSLADLGLQALQPLPDDLGDAELMAMRDVAVDLADAMSAIPTELLRYLGGPALLHVWDQSDPTFIAISFSLLIRLFRNDPTLDPTPVLEAVRERGWMGS